nr:RHS repeat-associated core domain-containing protein [Lysobacter pythonis]
MKGITYTKARRRVRPWIWALWLCCLPVVAWSQVVEYIHTDALGSPVAVTNASGQVIERTGYAPYGEKLGKANDDRPGYTGHVMDSATGLTYMQQRYYDPMLGRFLSVDPVTALTNGDMRHFNRYVYAYNNPYRFTDPDGRCPWCAGAGIGVGLELARQIVTGEIKDTSLKGIAGNVGKALVAGAAGATGAGIAAGVAKLTTSMAVRATVNGVAGAAIGAASTGANNAIQGNEITSGMGTTAIVGGAAGAAGSLVGDAIDVARSAVNTKAVDSIPLADRNLLEHIRETTTGGTTNSSAVGAAAAASNVMSNSGGMVESCGVRKEC